LDKTGYWRINLFEFIKDYIRDIRKYGEKSSITNEFDGYGFMKRVYGIESMPRFETVAKLARTDVLTKTYNRIAFDDFMEKEIASAKRYKEPVSLVASNIDNFRELSFKYSYLVCDEIIVEVSKILKMGARKSDILFRWVGHMFVIIMPHTNLKNAETGADKLRETIQKHDFKHDVGQITCSFGAIEVEGGDSVDSLIKRMEAALAIAKSSGKNQVATLTKSEFKNGK